MAIISGPDTERAVDRADACANRTADDSADRARCAAAFMRAFFGAADEALRLRS
jgi:hypothetical protein